MKLSQSNHLAKARIFISGNNECKTRYQFTSPFFMILKCPHIHLARVIGKFITAPITAALRYKHAHMQINDIFMIYQLANDKAKGSQFVLQTNNYLMKHIPALKMSRPYSFRLTRRKKKPVSWLCISKRQHSLITQHS